MKLPAFVTYHYLNMDEKHKTQFLIFARLKSEKKLLEERIAELQGELLGVMLDIDGVNTKIETEVGNFSVKKMKKWTYPTEITEREDQLKRAKKASEQSGTATYEESPSLYFRLKGDAE